MSNSVLFIRINYFLTIIRLIALRCLNYKFDLILYSDKQIVTVRLSLYKLYRMANQLHKMIVIRKFSLAVCHVSDKRGILLYMSGDVYCALYISIIIVVTDIFFEQTFPHRRFQIIREQEQKEVK